MTIVIDDKDIRDPMCSCGKRGKVFLSAHKLAVHCDHCGKDVRITYPDKFYEFNIQDLSLLCAALGTV